jgi:hypothetical protein
MVLSYIFVFDSAYHCPGRPSCVLLIPDSVANSEVLATAAGSDVLVIFI